MFRGKRPNGTLWVMLYNLDQSKDGNEQIGYLDALRDEISCSRGRLPWQAMRDADQHSCRVEKPYAEG
jgi:hypothetical protein